MRSTNVNDAKKECSGSLRCHMFYDFKGHGNTFKSCEYAASIGISISGGSILYEEIGKETYT